MKRVWQLLLLPGLLLAARAAAQTPDDLASIELVVPRPSYWVGESLRVVLRIGVARERFAAQALQLSARALDLPVQVQAPWFDALPGCARLDAGGAADPSGASLALQDDLARTRRAGVAQRDGREFEIHELSRTFRPEQPGDLVLPPVTLRFAYATRFRDDFVQGRVPLDRHEAELRTTARTLRIEPLPVAGQPTGFQGAVGRFTLRATASPQSVAVGEGIALTVQLGGDGDLSLLTAPPPEHFAGFHLRGRRETRSAEARVLHYDLVLLEAAVREVPALHFDYFDPTPPGSYQTLRSAAIPIAVPTTAARAGARAPDPAAGDLRDLVAGVEVHGGARTLRLPALQVVTAIFGPWLLALLLQSALWLRARLRPTPARVRARLAAATFARQADHDLVAAFAEYLAAKLGCPAAAVIGTRVAARLQEIAVPALLASAAERLLDELVATRYRGGAVADRRDDVQRLVTALEART